MQTHIQVLLYFDILMMVFFKYLIMSYFSSVLVRYFLRCWLVLEKNEISPCMVLTKCNWIIWLLNVINSCCTYNKAKFTMDG